MGCPDENTVAAWLSGDVKAEDRLTLARHLDACASCREATSVLVRGDGSAEPLAATHVASRSVGPQLHVGTLVGGKYRLEHVLGEGGLGVVWAAVHEVTGRAFAIKVIKFVDPDLEKRALREARIAAQLGHPNIVDVLDVFPLSEGGPLALVMNRLKGESLDKLIAREGPLSGARTQGLLVPIAEALAHAHAKGVVHRDLKPQNLFVSEGGTPMLLDFGLSRLTASEGPLAFTSQLTGERAIVGTPSYMAPEQLFGEPADFRTDLWSFGAVLFECVTGERLFQKTSVGQVMKELAGLTENMLAARLSKIPPPLRPLTRSLLERERDRRPASTNDVAAALGALIL